MSDPLAPRRIVSLDQFRGYTVVGMLFVNFLGDFQVVPPVFKHHNTY
jgi:predicted acyltransferase